MSKRQRKGQYGFTLPEVLIAMSILAGLSAALAPLIYSVSRLQTQIIMGQSAAERAHTATAALERLGARILSPAQTGGAVRFNGSRQRVSFAVYDAGGHIQQGRLEMKPQGDGVALMLSLEAGPTGAPAQEISLWEGQGSATFSYYGAMGGEGAPGGWRSQWTGLSLPSLIRIEMTTPEEAPRSFLMPITAQGPLYCVFDTVAAQCRDKAEE
ncbi:MAG: type II secretion system protein [Pseudomonadota bacterium]